MVARLVRDWTEAEFAPGDIEVLERLATEVMRERSLRFSDEHHPAFLHPLRTTTLLLETGLTEVVAHRGALLFDTESAPQSPLPASTPDALAELLRVPQERLLEELLVVDTWLRTIWLAERLDQIRHLHLWRGEDRTAAALAMAEARELPLAQRQGGRLARAWADWMDKARRYRIVEKSQVRRIEGGTSI